MLFLNWSSDSDPGLPTKADVAGGAHWNLWRTRQPPFNELRVGSEVVLVDSWPGGGRLSWQVRATRVLAESYESKSAVISQIASTLEWPRREVRQNEYTVRGPERGNVLAWRYEPIRRLGIDRPPDMRFRPNGWLRVDDPNILRLWGISMTSKPPTASPRKSPIAQGRLAHDESVAVELRAMALAADWCRANGWPLVEDVSARCSWDIEARKRAGGRPLFVEVKGTTGRGPIVELTAGEVRHALEHPRETALIVVTGIKLTRGSRPLASGGATSVWHPWSPDETELTATMYRWRPTSAASGSSMPVASDTSHSPPSYK